MTEQQKKLLQKIQALAKNGSMGEKENAQVILKKLMDKFGVTEKMLGEEKKILFSYKIENIEMYKMLFAQILSTIVDLDKEELKGYHKENEKIFEWCFYLIPEQGIEIQAKYDFFLKKLKEDIETFYLAFITKNELISLASLNKESDSSLDEAETIKIAKLANVLDKHNYNLEIECKE